MKKASALSVLRHPRSLVRFLLDREAPILPRLMALFAVLYLFMPLDLVPDAIPILGWLDDIGIVGFALTWTARAAARYHEQLPSGPSAQPKPL